MDKTCHLISNRCMALLLALCLMLSSVSFGLFVSDASGLENSYQIGEHVTATLSGNGTLSIQGTGETYDYQNKDENRAPFYNERQLITQIEIADGIASIGDYLLYNCENLEGTLTLPSSVVRIGERAFSGDSGETAPAFTYLFDQFVETDITEEVTAAQEPAVGSEPSDDTNATEEETPEVESETDTESNSSTDHPVGGQTEQNAGTEPSAAGTDLVSGISDTESSVGPASSDSGPQKTIRHITQQELGEEIFYPGQLGVFECAEIQNQSFITAVSEAGYEEILSWTTVTFGDGFDSDAEYALPVTQKGAFLPEYDEIGLVTPENSQGHFAGWVTDKAVGEELAAHSFCTLPQGNLTALWDTLPSRDLTRQAFSSVAAQGAITFDLAQGPVTLGADYSGKDSEGNVVTGEHKSDNYYIITQSNPETATQNSIAFVGDGLTFQVELAGVNISKTFVNGDATDAAIKLNSSIFIPAYAGNEKHVTLYLSGNNTLDNIAYYTYSADDTTGTQASGSTLKITSASGDGSNEGTLTADATKRSRYTCIGGTGTRSPATGLTLAGGTITATNNEYEAAIGGGSNGYADIKITGGNITAIQTTGNAPAIGSGSGGSAAGANARIEITGGTVIAANQGLDGVAIGAGGLGSATASAEIAAGKAEITISGGTVIATAGNKNAISGGYHETTKSYADTTIQITGGSVTGTMTGTPTSDGMTEVKQTMVTLKSNGTSQVDLVVDSLTLSSGAAYGANDMKTDSDGKLFLWLPVSTAAAAAQAGLYRFSGSVESGGSGELTNSTVILDLAKGPVVLGETYSGKDSNGNDVKGEHNENNYYVIKQSDSAISSTTNTITFEGDKLTFQVVLDSINVDRVFSNTGNDDNRDTDSSLYIPAYVGAEKHVNLFLSGENKLNTICYYTINEDSHGTGEGRSASTLKITSAAGDGKMDGSLTIDATKKGRFSCIGATGDKSTATGITIAGGTIVAKNSGAEAAIGGGSNGFAEIFITGGKISATQNGNAPAIGSGSGTNAVGADANITISGGTIVAENINADGVAIGAGGSSRQVGGRASVTITGGDITANVVGGTAIGGGNSIDLAGGSAEVAISGGTVTAGGVIGGGFSSTFGYAEASISITGGSLNAIMSKTPTNGASNVYLTRATLYNADQRVTDTAVGAINIADYGMKDVRTDGNGTLYLWLPENTELTGAQADGNEFTGSILAKYAGILKYNSAKVYYSVHFPYDDRFTVYADAEKTTPITGTQIVPAGDVLAFWVQANPYDSNGHYYSVDAYRSADTSMTSLEAESSKKGMYAYALTVTSNTELLFVTQAGSGIPRVSLDISTANAMIGSDSVTIGGYTLSGYQGDFLLTSGGLPTAHMLMVKDGEHGIHIDRLVVQRSGNVIEVDKGTVNATASSFDNNLASTGYSAILVQQGAAFDLSVSGTDSLYIGSSGTTYSPIGGSGDIGIIQNGGFLTLSSGENQQITARNYTYQTNSLTGALPYSVRMTDGALVGYHNGSKLTAVGAAQTVSSQTTFTACAVSYALPNNVTVPTHSITANGDLGVIFSEDVTVQSVKRDGVDVSEFSVVSNTLTIDHSAAYGNLEITLRKEGTISCKAADYSAEYTGNAHSFTIAVGYPVEAKVQYSTDNINWSETPPTMTNVGNKTVYWKITAAGFNPLEGENAFTVTKGTNQWTVDLTCPSVQYGSSPSPNAQAKWGEATYSYYAASDLSQPLSEAPKEAGSYYVKAAVAATDNYDTMQSDFVPFTIETTVIYSTSGKIIDQLSVKDGVPISTAVSTPANGAFTVSYGFFYIPNSTSTPLALQLSEALPKGTKLTMLDICPSHRDKPRFFYYTVPDGGTASIKSTDFYQMGSTAHGTFENADATTAREVQYQLCVEFPKSDSATGSFTIQLMQGSQEIDKTMVTVTRTAPVTAGVLSFSAAAGERQLSATASVSGISGSSNVLAVSLLDSAGNAVSFPAGADITLEGRAPMVMRSGFAAFSGIGNGDYAVSVTGLPAGGYQLKADLCGAPENSAYPLADSISSVIAKDLTVTAPEYAVQARLEDGQRRVVDGSAGASLTFTVTYSGSGSLAVASQSKVNGNYVNLTKQWEVTGAGAAGGSPVSVTVNVPADTPPGTYRLVFKLGDAEFPYNVIVVS